VVKKKMKKQSGHVKAKVLSISSNPEDAEEELEEALEELKEYYIVDLKVLPNDLVAIVYFSRKKSESAKKHKYEEEEEED
jgi:hypothetical protein